MNQLHKWSGSWKSTFGSATITTVLMPMFSTVYQKRWSWHWSCSFLAPLPPHYSILELFRGDGVVSWINSDGGIFLETFPQVLCSRFILCGKIFEHFLCAILDIMPPLKTLLRLMIIVLMMNAQVSGRVSPSPPNNDPDNFTTTNFIIIVRGLVIAIMMCPFSFVKL